MKKNKKSVFNRVGRLAVSAMVLSNLTIQSVYAGNGETPSIAQSMFRNAFSAAMPEGTSLDQQKDLLYPVTPAAKMINLEMSPSESMPAYFDRLRAMIPDPSVFAEASKQSSLTPMSKSQLDNELTKLASDSEDLPLYIFAPGIFGEFIDDHPFQDVLDANNTNPSPYKQSFLKNLKDSNINAKFKTDLRLRNEDIKYVDYINAKTPAEKRNVGRSNVDLDKLILIGVIKDSTGKVIANTLTLDTKELSLESLGALRNNSIMFVRRVSKFFNLMGKTPKNIILEGYSRGTPIALDMLALGFEKKCSEFSDFNSDAALEHGCTTEGKNWTNNIHGFLGVAGVIYGSELADVGFKVPVTKEAGNTATANVDDQVMAKQLAALNKVLDEKNGIQYTPLRESYSMGDGVIDSMKKIGGTAKNNIAIDLEIAKITLQNTVKWIEFLKTMAEIQNSGFRKNAEEALKEVKSIIEDKDTNPAVIYSKLKTAVLKIKSGLLAFQKDLQTKRKVDLNASLAKGVLYLTEGFGELKYNDNIRQFRSLMEETLAAAEDLTSRSRFAWWQNNSIPTENIKYYTVSATMNENDKELNGSPLDKSAVSFYSYNTETPDLGGLIASYDQFINLGNFTNNDSQVSLHKSSFHPQIAPFHNKKNQQIFKAESLGLFHTHHWGLTLRTVTQLDSKKANLLTEPFPRVAILKGVLAAIANDPEYSIAERK